MIPEDFFYATGVSALNFIKEIISYRKAYLSRSFRYYKYPDDCKELIVNIIQYANRLTKKYPQDFSLAGEKYSVKCYTIFLLKLIRFISVADSKGLSVEEIAMRYSYFLPGLLSELRNNNDEI